MGQLRDPNNGCPWDKQQTFKTIVPHTIEEAYEVADTIERGNLDDLCDELGDLLFQVVFYAQLASETGRFDFADVVDGIVDKLERRHPHVFGDVEIDDVTTQTQHWEKLKADERKTKADKESHSLLDGIALALPAMQTAEKLQKRAAQTGFDWPDWQGVINKVNEEVNELKAAWDDDEQRQAEMGDLLFTCINLARHAGIDAEQTLRDANHKFEQRFRAMEQQFQKRRQSIHDATPDEMEAMWQAVKETIA